MKLVLCISWRQIAAIVLVPLSSTELFSAPLLGTRRCDKSLSRQTRLSPDRERDDSHQLLLCSALHMPSILVYHHMGCWANVRQMLQSSPQWTFLRHQVVPYTRSDLILQASSTTFYRCCKDPLGGFFFFVN